MEEQIKAEFEKVGFSLEDEEEILKKCLTFCINYKLTPSDLVSSWEVYYLNRFALENRISSDSRKSGFLTFGGVNIRNTKQFNGSSVQNAHMEGFLLHLQNEQKDDLIKEENYPHIYSSNDVDMLLDDESYDTKSGILGTPIVRPEQTYVDSPVTNAHTPASARPSKLASNRMTPFGQRSNKFIVQFTLNKSEDKENGVNGEDLENQDDDVIRRVRPIERCSLDIMGSQPEPGCRFMYDRIEDRFTSIENRIRRHASAFVATGLYEEPGDPSVASQKRTFSVGMVCCDGEGRLNEKSVSLQGSVEHSGGQRVRLDLHKLAHFSLFPGQVVGIKGDNPSGHCLIASEVVDAIPIPVTPDMDLPPAKKQASDQEFQPSSPTSNEISLSMIIAAGPFSTTDNLLFEPLTELLAYASRKQPQLLVLLGPFVNCEHPEISRGTIDRTYDELFNVEILRKLQDYTKYMGSAARVILVPSIQDAHHDTVFPQPAFDLHHDLKHQISSISNPGRFDANKVKVACCSVDILRHLSSEEISRIPADSSSRDRMGRLATHLLNQRSFYPLYPPSEDVPLDLSLAPEALRIPSLTDILVLPSDLAPFVKVLSLGKNVDGEQEIKSVAVNPGRLAKGVGGGTFVELTYSGDPDKTSASIIRM